MTGEKFVDVAGVRTRYFEKGTGDVLVLFHGGHFSSYGMIDSADAWGLNFDGLARWFHVYAVDKLGQGYTDNPKRDEDYTMAAVVQHAYGFLQTLGLRNVNVAGHSRGGYLVARLTLEHPELIKSCIIVDSNTLAPGMGRNEIVMANPPEPPLTRERQRWFFERYSYSYDHITEEWLEAVYRILALPKHLEAVAKTETAGLMTTRFLPHLAKQKEETLGWIRDGHLKTPTLLVWGYNDPTATLAQGHALFDLVAGSEPRSQMHIFNRAAHFSFREHPQGFNEVVRSFVRQG